MSTVTTMTTRRSAIAATLELGLGLVLVLAAAAGTARAEEGATAAPTVYHVPPADALAGERVTVAAEVQHGWSANLELRVRARGARAWRVIRFQRGDVDHYLAAVPAELLRPPGFEYFIASSPGDRLHFASADRPHPVLVRDPDAERERLAEVARHQGRRAQARVAAELVDFGRRTIEDTGTGMSHRVRDVYHRIEGDFTYRLFRPPLGALRFGYLRLIGTTPTTARSDGDCAALLDPGEVEIDDCAAEAGFRGGAWFELRARFSSSLAVDGRGLVVATPRGVGVGGRGELRFGDDMGSHFAVGSEVIQEVGSTFYARLGWDTVPRVPMATTIEISDYPSSHRDHGVRLLYDAAYAAPSGLRLGGRIGYQARDQFVGGVTGGVSATFDFWAL